MIENQDAEATARNLERRSRNQVSEHLSQRCEGRKVRSLGVKVIRNVTNFLL